MTTGKIIDLLYGRDGVSLHHWLKGQNNILTVNRDRATSYSSVIDKINYQINQIADRFHLVKNLSEHVDAIIHNHSRLINSIILSVQNGLISSVDSIDIISSKLLKNNHDTMY